MAKHSSDEKRTTNTMSASTTTTDDKPSKPSSTKPPAQRVQNKDDVDYKGYLSTASATMFICYIGYQLIRYHREPEHVILHSHDFSDHSHSHSSIAATTSSTATWSSTQTLFIKAFIAALTSGLGGFPLYLVGELPKHIMGLAITFAAGLMSGCSVVLFMEALESDASLLSVTLYFMLGMVLIHFISQIVTDHEDFEFAGLKGQSASKALLIVLSMGLHSLGEGISVGVSATSQRESIGLLVIVSLAIHNIPEGIAVSLLLMSQGMNVWLASIFAVISNIPQPLIAIPSFMFLESFKSLLPIGFGVASGAMTYIVCTELIPEAKDKISRSLLLSTFFTSLGFIVSCAVCAT